MTPAERGHPDLDETAFGELLEASQDLHADSMRAMRDAAEETVELGMERRAHGGFDPEENAAFAQQNSQRLQTAFGGKLLAGIGAGAALAALAASSAWASQPTDIQILQTAASIEVLAVATYQKALTLPFIGGSSANPVVKTFAEKTMEQHAQHKTAFNAVTVRLGGKKQENPDPVLLKVVQAAEPGLTSPLPVVKLALELENGAAETYIVDCSALSDGDGRKTTASIMGVEAQHAAILSAVQALLEANAPQLIALPPNVGALPSAAGSVGFPNAFYPTSQARPATEGALSS
ncbi:ferritin-like domain-containing protein [Aciditerrimonas ferrireducens]|jgi:hypothetical protein|uniref:Ferritin-like domain-containing protein n=1 Tax=Aciditerrimonas ferrireducens TaxID=667306 RepID=A0ABV6BZK5_9ACTN